MWSHEKPQRRAASLLYGVVHVQSHPRCQLSIVQGVMAVFLREPLLDWQKEARLLRTEGAAYAGLKVELAKARLSGRHPAAITVEELKAMHSRQPHWKSLKAIVEGDPARDERARVMAANKPSSGSSSRADVLTVDQQVACLLDQAVDPNILGRTWEGWKPFM